MPLISVPEYAKQQKVSVQAIYGRIKRGSIETVIEDGIKMIEVQGKTKKLQSKCKCKHYKREIKSLKKQIKRVIKDKDRQYLQLEKLFDRLLQVQTPRLSEVIDLKPIKKKRKK